MPTYYAELTGGTIKAKETFSGGTIYSTGGATVIQNIKSAAATPSSSSQHISITPDVGYDAIGEVQLTVDAIPPEYIIPTGTKTITTNGTHDVKAYENAYVNVQGGGGATLETKSVSYTPSETAISDALLPDVGYDGFSEVDVSVSAIPSNYVGSSVPRKSSSDLTASGATVTAPSGYYASNATKTISNASQALSDAYALYSGDLEVELNTSSGGYVANGNQYLQFENFTTPVPTTTYYATDTDQVIMLQNSMAFGAQTIKGVTTTNLSAANIKKDVVVQVGDSADPDRIVSVTGTYEGGGGGFSFDDYFNHNLSGAVSYTGSTLQGVNLANQKITSLSFPNVTTFNNINGGSGSANMFANMTHLTTFYAPSATRVSDYMFSGCTSLTSVNLYALQDSGAGLLQNCTAIQAVAFPSMSVVWSYLFMGCTSLQKADILASNYINSQVFKNCSNLTTIVIRKTGSPAELRNIDSFSGTPYDNGGTGGVIYVPSSLISSYQTASNWSTLYGYGTCTFQAIEGSQYENYYADGTPIS